MEGGGGERSGIRDKGRDFSMGRDQRGEVRSRMGGKQGGGVRSRMGRDQRGGVRSRMGGLWKEVGKCRGIKKEKTVKISFTDSAEIII